MLGLVIYLLNLFYPVLHIVLVLLVVLFIFTQLIKIIKMKKILENALKNVITTIAGSVAGIAEIQSGISEKNTTKIILGIGIMIIGIFAKEND
jgi:sensor histidine kinase regulating citrate/malate metabolism